MTELVSVLLPVYKEPMIWVEQALRSVVAQTYKDLEIIVILDNPERADVISYINSMLDKRVRLYVNSRNEGLVKSLNKGIALSKGQYIARMDADDISLAERIEKEVSFLKDNDYDIVGCSAIIIDDSGKEIGRSVAPVSKAIGHLIKYCSPIRHPSWLVKKELYEKLEGYRPIDTAEDYDFLIRCVLTGAKIGALQEYGLKYRRNDDGISRSKKGQQKVTSHVLRKQLFSRSIRDSVDIENELCDKTELIRQLSEYYSFTRLLRRKLKGEKCNEKLRWKFRFILFMLYDRYFELQEKRIIKYGI